MKTKKALAVVLAVVMLVIPLAVSSFAAGTILTNPIKTAYNDSEHFNPQGLVILVDGDSVIYTPADTNFRFVPALDELLTVQTTKVDVYYDNVLVGTIPVVVEHILGEFTEVGNGHGQYCLGCGSLHNFEKHYDYSFGEKPDVMEPAEGDYDHIDEWIPNDDGSIFLAQTETGTCTICNAEVTKDIPGTAKFDTLFNKESLAPLEGTILEYVSMILVSLIQMLVGIK